MKIFDSITETRPAVIQAYLKNGGNPNQRNDLGNTLLHEAVYQGSVSIIRMLLDYGADVNAVDDYGNTPMQLAGIYGYKEIGELLLEYGAEVDAISENRSWTPLMLALNENHPEMANWLIRHGANPNFVDKEQGWTPFLVACENGLTDLIMELLQRGAEVDAKLKAGDARGKSAIHLASYFGEVEIIKALIKHGADINQIPEGGGLAPLHWAVYNHLSEFFDFLLEHGADVDLPATGLYDARTPLHFSVSGDRMKMTKRLLQAGADPMIEDMEGRSPLDIALDRFEETGLDVHRDMVMLLEKYV